MRLVWAHSHRGTENSEPKQTVKMKAANGWKRKYIAHGNIEANIRTHTHLYAHIKICGRAGFRVGILHNLAAFCN